MNKILSIFTLVSLTMSGDSFARIIESCNSFNSVPSDLIWNSNQANPVQGQIKYAENLIHLNRLEMPKAKRFKSIKLSYNENGKGMLCEKENGETRDIDAVYPVTVTYTPTKGGSGLISISIGLWQKTSWDSPGSSISFSGIINLYNPRMFAYYHEESPMRIDGDVFKPNPGGSFAIGYPERTEPDPSYPDGDPDRGGVPLHIGRPVSFHLCTWGDAFSGVRYGVPGIVTNVDCEIKMRASNKIYRNTVNYLYLHDYAVFVPGPGGRVVKDGAIKLDRENYHINVQLK